jgi:hypothetical protein
MVIQYLNTAALLIGYGVMLASFGVLVFAGTRSIGRFFGRRAERAIERARAKARAEPPTHLMDDIGRC